MIAETRSQVSVREGTLYVAFELGKTGWKLAMTSGFGVAPVLRTVGSGEWAAVDRAIAYGRRRCGLPASAWVVSCYEAGRDGFWIHRALVTRGIANRVVDSSSIEVKRRARRTKTDRLDSVKLVLMLVRVCAGEAGVE
jgi:transposase